jgi:hypothetical protein
MRRLRTFLPMLIALVLAVAGWVCLPRPDAMRGLPLEAILAAQGYSNANPYTYFVGPGNCNTTVSAGSTGTNGLTTVGASNTPVVQAQTDNAGVVHTHTYICNIAPPYWVVTTGTGLQIVDAVFLYGIQTTNLGVQAAVLASGTFNAGQVFSSITYPTPGNSETPSTVLPARADSGTLVITPIAASFNVTTTTAGSFVAAKFAPATGTLVWKTDLQQLLLTVILTNITTSATITNSPGVLVHFKSS